MKWVFLLFMIVLVPVLTNWLQQDQRRLSKVAMAIGLLPFLIAPFHLLVAPISWGAWPGAVKGMEITLIDPLALAVCLSMPRLPAPPPFRTLFLVYMALAAASMLQATVPMASGFYVWQLARTYLLFSAVCRIAQKPQAMIALLRGMLLGLCYEAVIAVEQRLGGALQSAGNMGHQNLLGMVSHFALFPSLAMLLAGNRSWLFKAGPIAGIVVAVLGASRATIGLVGIGYVVLLILSAKRKWTPRKLVAIQLSVAVLAISVPLAMQSLDTRFEGSQQSEYDERAAFERAAHMIISDHPLGIGANQYVNIANTGGYSDRAGVTWWFGSRTAPVHNTYLLVAAEMSYLAMFVLIALMAQMIWVALKGAWRDRNDDRGDILLGLAVSIGVVAVHAKFEWIFVTYHVHYMLAMNMGLIAGLALQVSRGGARGRKPAMPSRLGQPERHAGLMIDSAGAVPLPRQSGTRRP